jgi:hypothetical protein
MTTRPQHRYAWHTIAAIVIALFFVLVLQEMAFALNAEPYVRAETGDGAGPFFERVRWSPYIVGVGIGVLSWLAFLFSDHPLGVSTAYARTAGMIERAARGQRAEQKSYYQEYAPKVDWEWMLVLGLLIGAGLSAITSGDFRWEVVPPLWKGAFGESPVARILVALAGGWLIGFGARWAGGCTSGHGISGTLQLVLSSWVAVICFFVGGVGAALLIYHVIA